MADGSGAINVSKVANTEQLLAALNEGGVILFAQGTYDLTQSLTVSRSIAFQADPDNTAGVTLNFSNESGIVISEGVTSFAINSMAISGGANSTALISAQGSSALSISLAALTMSPAANVPSFDFGRTLVSPTTGNSVSFETGKDGRVIAGEGATLSGQHINLGSGKAVTYLPGIYKEKGAAIKLGSGLIDIASNDKIASVTIAAEGTRAGDTLALTAFGTTLATFGRVDVAVAEKDGALVMTLTSRDGRNLPVEVAEALLEQITFQNSTISPGSSRTFTYTVTDVDGDTFTAQSILIIDDLNEAPTLTLADSATDGA
jgi:hypothetical protein